VKEVNFSRAVKNEQGQQIIKISSQFKEIFQVCTILCGIAIYGETTKDSDSCEVSPLILFMIIYTSLNCVVCSFGALYIYVKISKIESQMQQNLDREEELFMAQERTKVKELEILKDKAD
jgi:hypothetical protein